MHALPDTLIRDAKTSSISADYQELFIRTVEPLVQEHHADCLANSPTTCSSCDGPATRILMTPMSYLHRTPPHLAVAVTSLCERSDCERDIRADTEQGPVEETTVPTEPALDFFCEYCGIVGALRDCPSCGLVAYCNEVRVSHSALRSTRLNCTIGA